MLTKPFANYPHIRRCGAFYFFAGQGCRSPIDQSYAGLRLGDDGNPVAYDILAQTRAALQNVMNCLESVALGVEDLCDATVFLKNKCDFNHMNEVWNIFFAKVDPPPTRTTVFVSDLPGHNYIEIKAIAYRGERTS